MSRLWIVLGLLAACERNDDGVAIGWHPIAVGQRIEITTHTEMTGLLMTGESHVDQVRRFQVLATDGDHASRVRVESIRDDRVAAGKHLAGVAGTFEAAWSHGAIEVTKPDGSVPSELERREVASAVKAMFTTMQLQRSFFTHRFRDGEKYEPTAEERVGLGIGDKAHVTISLVSHDAGGITLAVDADSTLDHPHDGFARGALTGRLEIATGGKRDHVTTDTDMFDAGNAKVGHIHYDSLQVTLSD